MWASADMISPRTIMSDTFQSSFFLHLYCYTYQLLYIIAKQLNMGLRRSLIIESIATNTRADINCLFLQCTEWYTNASSFQLMDQINCARFAVTTRQGFTMGCGHVRGAKPSSKEAFRVRRGLKLLILI